MVEPVSVVMCPNCEGRTGFEITRENNRYYLICKKCHQPAFSMAIPFLEDWCPTEDGKDTINENID